MDATLRAVVLGCRAVHKLFRTSVSRKAADKGRLAHEVQCGVFGEALLECNGIMREPCQSMAGMMGSPCVTLLAPLAFA